MIICIIGGIGSGKSLTAVKEVIDKNDFAITNFKLKNYKNYRRLKISDVIIKGDKVKDHHVNWEFWDKIRKEHKNFSIYIDEIHNLIHSRTSMSKTNILMSKWLSQIRKITSDSIDNNLYIISQTIRKIDVDFRELAQVFIVCNSFIQGKGKNKKIYILLKYYTDIDKMQMGLKPLAKKVYVGNKYFKYYDTLEMINFADAEEYV